MDFFHLTLSLRLTHVYHYHGGNTKIAACAVDRAVLRKATVDRGIRFLTEQYGCRQGDKVYLTPLEKRKRKYCHIQTMLIF